MGPDLLMERLQRAVAPDYRVVRQLGVGGMGTVYLAHEVTLNRDVAIKVLRVERATAAGAAAFHREAQTLASLRHPNVVVIYRPGEAEGLHFYIMELISGPTLEDRLASGPLPAADVARIGIDVLRGLEHVHRLGLVHRDIKPSNIFLLPDRTVLSDFGIATFASPEPSGARGEGTPDYMAPEQVAGTATTARVDIYSLGVVLYEATSGRRFHEQGPRIDWSGIPGGLARVLRRAVAENPDERWRDAVAFHRALAKLGAPVLSPAVVLAAGAVALIGATLFVFWPRHSRPAPLPARTATPTVSFAPIEYVGPSERAAVKDSLARLVRRDLSTHVTFDDRSSPLVVQARMTVSGDDVGLRLSGGIPAEFHVPFDRWSSLSDSVAYRILLDAWAGRNPLVSSLPTRALPHSAEGLAQLLEAEQLVAEERWSDAHQAYLKAEATDRTCWICSWRIIEIERWLSQQPDPERVRQVQRHADSLPPLFRSLVHAAQFHRQVRLDTLRGAAERSREIFLGWFQLGDELFHRGPLVGHRRAEAIPPLERAARLRPDFGPTWEHLAWVATAEGDSADAAEALDSLRRQTPTPDAFASQLRGLLEVGFAWRFLAESSAVRVTADALRDSTTRRSADLGAGPRLLPTFDAPRGAIALGSVLERSSSRDVGRSGLIAQMLGAVALGRLDSARSVARRLTQLAPENELEFFSAELQAALAVLDSASVPAEDARDGLRLWLLSNDDALRRRAAWISSLLEQRSRLGSTAPEGLTRFLAADSLAAVGLPRGALKRLEAINVDSLARVVDPFFRAIVQFRRADWRAQIGDLEGARGELIWHEHLDLDGLPTELPQAAEVDWAFGTLARWRLARLLDRGGQMERGAACSSYGAVIRHWSHAPPPFGARADTARTRARELSCAPALLR